MSVAERKAGGHVAPIAVVGMGNVLLGDDGFGPCVMGILADGWMFPDSVELIDAGTPGLDLAGLLCGREAVIFVDTVAAAAAPGQLCVYQDGELGAALALKPRVSPHDPALGEALAIAALAGDGPRSVSLVGVVPETVEVGLGLSASVSAAAHLAAATIVTALEASAARPRRRRERASPTLWWIGDGVTQFTPEDCAATPEGS